MSDQRFCSDCGHPLQATARTVDAPAAPTAPATAERRLVSVLFLDIAGFTPFTESRDAEDVRAFITRYFDLAKQVIERFGGTVDKYIGDAVMAIWGATRAEEDDAERAVRAGLELIDMVAKLGADEGIDTMAARAGIMTGEASVGPGANDLGLVLGDIVNTASRLQSIGSPGQVLVGQATRDLTDRAILYIPVGEQSLKGKEEAVPVHRAERILAERGGAGRADIIEAPFVGRDEELRLLKDQLHATTRERRSRMVSIIGQAGIGKSRLVWEFEKYIDGLVENVYWHHGRAPSYSDGLAMWSLAEMVRGRCKITETEDPATARTLLDATLSEFVEPEQQAWVRPQLSALLGLSEGSGERSEMLAAIRLFFEGISRRDTTVLVFEDLHWADATTLDFVEELSEWSRDFPIFVVALARPDLLDTRSEWGSLQRGGVTTHLPPLADADMHTLVGSLIPALDETTRAAIVRPAGGVPLFAIEMVRMLLNDGTLVQKEDGTFQATSDISNLAVPDTVHAVIGARLDRLDTDDRGLVQDASILGQTFTVEALSAISNLDEDALRGRLTALVRREMFELIRDPLSPERGQYGFVQSLIREVARSRIARDVRRTKHLDVGRYLASLAAEDLSGAIASHFLDAVELGANDPVTIEETATAVGAAVRRAQKVHSYEQVVSLAGRAEDAGLGDDALAPLWVEATEAAMAHGESDLAVSFVSRLHDHHAASGDEAGTALALGLWGEVLTTAGQARQAIALLRPHLAGGDDVPRTEGHARLAAALARALMLQGDEGIEEASGQALVVAEALNLEEVAAQVLITKGTYLAASNRPREGRALLAKGVEIAKANSLTGTYLRGLGNSAHVATSAAEAHQLHVEALVEARRVGEVNHFVFCAAEIGRQLAASGSLDDLQAMMADPLATRAAAWGEAWFSHNLVRCHLNLGDPTEATAAQRRAEQWRGSLDAQGELLLLMSDIRIRSYEGDMSAARDLSRSIEPNALTRFELVAHAFVPMLVSGSTDLTEEFRGWTTEMPERSWAGQFVTGAQAVSAALVGDRERAVRLAQEAAADCLEAALVDDGCLIIGTVASHLPPGGQRDELTSLLGSTLAATPLAGVEEITARILSGEFRAG